MCKHKLRKFNIMNEMIGCTLTEKAIGTTQIFAKNEKVSKLREEVPKISSRLHET